MLPSNTAAIADGRIAESIGSWDASGMLQQLGVLSGQPGADLNAAPCGHGPLSGLHLCQSRVAENQEGATLSQAARRRP
jgi:hypothetical protein